MDIMEKIVKVIFIIFFVFIFFVLPCGIFGGGTIEIVSSNSPSTIKIKPRVPFVEVMGKGFKIDRAYQLWIYLNSGDNWEYYQKIPDKYKTFVINTAFDCDKLPLWAIQETFGWESGWNPKAYNINRDPVTKKIISIDRGIGQINSKFEKEFVRKFYKGDPKKFDVWNAYDNIQVSIYHLNDLRKTFKGNWYKVLCAYNGGSNRVYHDTIKDKVKRYAKRILTKANKKGYIPKK